MAGLPARAGAQAIGLEFQVNTYTASMQATYPRGRHVIASDADGNFVVVWHSRYQDGSAFGVFGQRYDSEGAPLGNEFRVNSYTTGFQWKPTVASDADGNFVVVWMVDDPFPMIGADVVAQRFDRAGGVLGSEFRVNSYTTGTQRYPAVASDAVGNFVVVWFGVRQGDQGYGVSGQRYDASGTPRGSEFRVNSYTIGSQSLPSVASEPDGNFVVVWESFPNQDGSNSGIFAQRYDSGGVSVGVEFRVNTYTTDNQRAPSVASDAEGNFVVVWQSRYQDGSAWGVFGQRYDNAGGALGSEFRVHSYPTRSQRNPSVAMDASGNFVVVWASYAQDGSNWGIFGQRFDSSGRAQGGEFRVNSYTTYRQEDPSVWATGGNQFVVSWDSDGQDGSLDGVFGQRYDFGGRTIVVVSPNTNVKWGIGSRQRIKWTHDLGLSATFRIELDRSDDGTYEELIADDVAVESATQGQFAWTVTGPQTTKARVRISWTDDLAVADSSDVTFQIRPAP
jgi:lambda repressor-like predicted transcriptional regulator